MYRPLSISAMSKADKIKFNNSINRSLSKVNRENKNNDSLCDVSKTEERTNSVL